MNQHAKSTIEALDQSESSNSFAAGGTILPLLLENLDDPNPRARVLAAREISDYTDDIVVKRLLDLAEHDPDLKVRCAAIAGLGNFIYLGGIADYDLETDQELDDVENRLADADFERVYDFLLAVYHDEQRSLDEKRRAVESLSFSSNDTVEGLITELYARPEKAAKSSALIAMGNSGSVRWTDILKEELYNPDPDLQLEAISAVGEIGLESLGKDLRRLTYAEEKDVMLVALWSLGQTGWDGAFERLDELTLHQDPEIRDAADEAMEEWLFYNGLASEYDEADDETYLEDE